MTTQSTRRVSISTMLALLLYTATCAGAASFSFTGALTQDDDVQLFVFTVDVMSLVTVQTLSHTGGTNAAGVTIPSGGFDPVLSLFNASGLLIDVNDDGATSDAFLASVLQPGHYPVSLTQYDNFATGPTLSDGFLRAGDPTFTSAFGLSGATGPFLDGDGNQRTGAYALDILNVAQAAAVPEPATLLLFGAGLACFMLIARWQQRCTS